MISIQKTKKPMRYEFHILDVQDADALVINYKINDFDSWYTAVVDAGNVGDGRKVKQFIKHVDGPLGINRVIDYAFCTHPDKDHKGGFFDLLDDRYVSIKNFCVLRPDDAVSSDIRVMTVGSPSELVSAAKALYDHPINKRRNLLDEMCRQSNMYQWQYGVDLPGIPIKILGPNYQYFKEASIKMATDFREITDEVDFETYAEDELPSDEDAKSIIDEEMEDSATNKSSMILLFHPQGRNFLLAGDACSASIHQAINDYPEIIGSTLKVPHHGSKHNLTTEVIDLLRPGQSVISCKGSKKHPNSAIVHFLSKYGKVFATSKSGTLTYTNGPVANPAIPLRDRHD